MESELAACPVCGKAVFENHAEVFCEDELCVYMSATVEIHNTLCRRAEIGRLVEAIVALDRPVMLSPPHKSEPDLYRTSSTVWCITKGASLLEALRALAAEIGGER